MKFSHATLLASALLSVGKQASAIQKSDVLMFKGDKKGVLHLVPDPLRPFVVSDNSPVKVSVILNNKIVCGHITKVTSQSKKATSDKATTTMPCHSSYVGNYQFSKKHASKRVFLTLGFKGCGVKILRKDRPNSQKKIVAGFKKRNRLPPYLSEAIKVFSDKKGPKYLAFTGVMAKTKKSPDLDLYPHLIEGIAKRDFILYGLKNKKIIMQKRNEVCCDPATEPILLCELPSQMKSACFDPYIAKNLIKIEGLLEHKKNLYTYNTMEGIIEGFAGYVWKLNGHQKTEVFHQSVYALGGCR